MVKKYGSLRNLWSDSFRSEYEQWAGPLAEKMIISQSETENGLSDPRPEVRKAALLLSLYYWEPTDNFVTKCEQMIFNDPDPEIRDMAIISLSVCHSGTKEKGTARLFANLVIDESMPIATRIAAYEALQRVEGLPLFCSQVTKKFLDFRFPEDVNWELVQSFIV